MSLVSTMAEYTERRRSIWKNWISTGQLFVGNPQRQIKEDYYWASGGKIVAVRDLKSAKIALNLVISQGEGAWPKPGDPLPKGFADPPLQMGHYYRFNEIAKGRRYKNSDDPDLPPTGDPIEVDYSTIYPIKVNPDQGDYKPGTRLFEFKRIVQQTIHDDVVADT